MEIIASEMGQRIKQVRKAQHITQEALAEQVDLSSHYIYELERGKKVPRLITIVKIAKALSSSLDYLVSGIHPTEMDYVCTDELDKICVEMSAAQREKFLIMAKSFMSIIEEDNKKGI